MFNQIWVVVLIIFSEFKHNRLWVLFLFLFDNFIFLQFWRVSDHKLFIFRFFAYYFWFSFLLWSDITIYIFASLLLFRRRVSVRVSDSFWINYSTFKSMKRCAYARITFSCGSQVVFSRQTIVFIGSYRSLLSITILYCCFDTLSVLINNIFVYRE